MIRLLPSSDNLHVLPETIRWWPSEDIMMGKIDKYSEYLANYQTTPCFFYMAPNYCIVKCSPISVDQITLVTSYLIIKLVPDLCHFDN